MKTVNIQAAKTHLSRLVEEAVAGEEIVLAKAGRPLVRLQPVASDPRPRRLGGLRGQIREAPDCWEPDAGTEEAFSQSEVLPKSRADAIPRRK